MSGLPDADDLRLVVDRHTVAVHRVARSVVHNPGKFRRVTPEMDPSPRRSISGLGVCHAGGMRRWVGIVVLVAVSCSVQDGPTDRRAPTPGTAIITTVDSTTEPVPPSTAVITIGPAVYELDAVCAAGGAGEVEVGLVGEDVNGLPVVGYVRAFLGEPYVGLVVGEGDEAVRFEPRLEGVLPFELTDHGAAFPEVEFVTGLDLETGAFIPAGLGSVLVNCGSYVRELPAAPFE